jgi:hypothetical protein
VRKELDKLVHPRLQPLSSRSSQVEVYHPRHGGTVTFLPEWYKGYQYVSELSCPTKDFIDPDRLTHSDEPLLSYFSHYYLGYDVPPVTTNDWDHDVKLFSTNEDRGFCQQVWNKDGGGCLRLGPLVVTLHR